VDISKSSAFPVALLIGDPSRGVSEQSGTLCELRQRIEGSVDRAYAYSKA
jgi:hypothetical protein